MTPQDGTLWVLPKLAGGLAFKVWPLSRGDDSIPEGYIQEARDYWFELRGTSYAMQARLYADDLEIEPLRPPDSATARWRWTPGFYAGSVQIRLVFGDGRQHEFELITDPDQRKLTRDQFDCMIQDVLEDTIALFALSSHRIGLGRGMGNEPPPVARLEYLRSRMEKLERIVTAISRNPQRLLHSEEKSSVYYKTRHANSSEILRSFRSGQILKETAFPKRLPGRLRGFLPERIRHTGRVFSADTRENREIKACLRTWLGWLQQIGDTLERTYRFASRDAEDRSQNALWQRRVRKMVSRVQKLLNLPLFQEVSDQPARPTATSVFRRVPTYRAFLDLYRDFSLGIANVFGAHLNLPLARTFELYELWCFLRLLRAAIDIYGIVPSSLEPLFSSPKKGSVVIPSGMITLPLNSGVVLAFQLSFREYWLEDGSTKGSQPSRGSFSRSMIPDIVIESTQSATYLIALDAKYRVGSQLNDALSSIHMYRDALVKEEPGGEVPRIVNAAYIISPDNPFQDQLHGWQEAGLPGRLFHPEYRRRFKFGALTLKPGMSIATVQEALKSVIADAST